MGERRRIRFKENEKKRKKKDEEELFSNIYIYPRSVLLEKSRNKRYSYSIFNIFREFMNVKKKRESSSIHFFHFSSQTFSPISFYVYVRVLVYPRFHCDLFFHGEKSIEQIQLSL